MQIKYNLDYLIYYTENKIITNYLKSDYLSFFFNKYGGTVRKD